MYGLDCEACPDAACPLLNLFNKLRLLSGVPFPLVILCSLRMFTLTKNDPIVILSHLDSKVIDAMGNPRSKQTNKFFIKCFSH